MVYENDVITALVCCADHGDDACNNCPYRGKTTRNMSCRQQLCIDAADKVKSMSDLYDARNELMAENAALRAKIEELEKPTSVGSDEKKTPKAVGEGLAAIAINEAAYWEGQADALKWFLRGYCGLGLDAEVADDV